MSIPLYEAAKEALAGKIQSGRYAPGSVLPLVDDLSEELGFTKATLRKALLKLADEGVVDRVRRKGTVVAARPKRANIVLLQTGDPDLNELLVEPLYRNLHAAGYGIDVVPFTTDFNTAIDNCERLRQAGRSAEFLLSLHHCADPEFLELASHFRHYMYFSMGGPYAASGHCVGLDWSLAARQVMELLLRQGHRKVAVAQPGDGSFVATTAELCRHLLEMADAEFVPCGFLDGNPAAVKALAEQGVTAYWAVSDYEAIMVMKHLATAGVTVPEQFSVIGRNDTRWSRLSEITLSSATWHPERIAQQFVQCVRDCLNGATPQQYVVHPTLIRRDAAARAR